MKLKNVKVGVRVVLKENSENDYLKKGAIGTIQEDGDSIPFVDWDNFVHGYSRGVIKTKSVWSVPIGQLKRIK